MTAATLVAELQARGVILEPEGRMLRVRPASRLSPAELETLRAHKVEVLALLTESQAPPPSRLPSPWPGALVGFGPRRTIPYSPGEVCLTSPFPDETLMITKQIAITVPAVTGTWTAYGSVPLCLRHAQQAAEPWP